MRLRFQVKVGMGKRLWASSRNPLPSRLDLNRPDTTRLFHSGFPIVPVTHGTIVIKDRIYLALEQRNESGKI